VRGDEGASAKPEFLQDVPFAVLGFVAQIIRSRSWPNVLCCFATPCLGYPQSLCFHFFTDFSNVKIFVSSLLLFATGFITGYMLATEEKMAIANRHSWPKPAPYSHVNTLAVRTMNTRTRLLKSTSISTSAVTTSTSVKTSISTSAVTTSTSVNNTGQITIHFRGRLGNEMFEYSAMLGAAMMNNLVPFITIRKGDIIPKVFELGAPTVFEDHKHFSKVLGESHGCGYENNLEHLDLKGERGKVRVTGYRQSWKYFYKYNETIRRHFTFKAKILKEASDVLNKLKGARKNVTLVAVHIRRGDMISKGKQEYGYLVADKQYFDKSMSYFRNKYNNVLFIVCSDGMDWAKTALKAVNHDVAFAEGNSDALDLAIMSRCHHTIMSVGSFGWWASWLAGGEVIYYKTPAKPGSSLAGAYIYADYYPANWKPMI
jgi:galactoside 2-L-fucosyltransferase 1/2